jgi:hypothetical protein
VPLVGGSRGGEDAHQRGFARAVGAKQSKHATADVQIDVVQRTDAPIVLDEMIDLNVHEAS